MNWHAAVWGFLFTLGVLGGLAGLVWTVDWAGRTYGPAGAAVTLVVLLAVAIGLGMGISERDR